LDDPQWQNSVPSDLESERWIRESYSRIRAGCLHSGLEPSEADDVAQDIWLWLLRNRTPALAVSLPWLSGVVRNYVLRYRRRTFRQKAREGLRLDSVAEPRAAEDLPQLEANELLDRVATAVPATERRLLGLIRGGHSLAEAARILGIPRGSRAYHHQRLIACARRELGRNPVRPATRSKQAQL